MKETKKSNKKTFCWTSMPVMVDPCPLPKTNSLWLLLDSWNLLTNLKKKK
jgi:hypothetical protein